MKEKSSELVAKKVFNNSFKQYFGDVDINELKEVIQNRKKLIEKIESKADSLINAGLSEATGPIVKKLAPIVNIK